MRADVRRRLLDLARGRVQLCRGPGCRRFTVAHRLLRKDGVFLGDDWLCSAECLEAAVAGVFGGDRSAGVYAMPRLPRMPFRLLLLQRGVLSETGLGEALLHSERTGLSLARALLSLGLVTPAELAASLAAENGCAFYALAPAPVELDAELPPVLADRYEAAAVHSAPGRVLIGFVYRIDRELLRSVERMGGRKAEGCFITAAHRERQLALGGARADGVLERAEDCRDAARAAVRHILRFGAERLRVDRVGGVAWLRMSAEGGVEDRFFQISEDASRAIPLSATRVFRGSEKKLQML